jgi:hypothetical protein
MERIVRQALDSPLAAQSQNGQGSLALIPRLLLKVLHVKLLEILEVFGS